MKSKLKTNAGRLLAFILILSFMLPISDAERIYAAPAALNVAFNKTLIEGKNNSVPTYSATSTGEGEVFFSWDFSRIDGTQFSDGSYLLWYYADNGKRVEFTFTKRGQAADVTYDVKTYQGGVWKSLSPQSASYRIYYSGNGSYVPFSDFIKNNYNVDPVSEPNYQVIDFESEQNASLPKIPTFTITPDRGFSFQYDNRKVQFLWNRSDNSIYIVTSGINPGRIYDINLAGYVGQTISITDPQYSSYPKSNVKVLAGIDLETFRSIPIANGGVTVSGSALDLAVDSDLAQYVGTIDMPVSGANSYPPGAYPSGAPNHELRLRFDIPKEYNESSQTFSALPDYTMPVTVDMGSRVAGKALQVKVNDIVKPGSDWSSISVAGANGFVRNVPGNTGRIDIRLSGMEAGLIFTPVTISFTGGPVTTRSTTVPFGKVYTFMSYDIIFQENRSYIRVTPFQGAYPGTYMLKIDNKTPIDAVLVNNDGVKEVLIPFNITQGHEHRLQVFFTNDEKPFPNYDTSGAFYSQIVSYVANNPLSLGTPNNFTILKDKTILYPNQNNGESILNFTAQWEIANESVLRNMISENGGAPVEIVYQVNKALVPDTSDPSFQKFTALKLTASLITDPNDNTKTKLDWTITTDSSEQTVKMKDNGAVFATKNDLSSGVNDPIHYVAVSFETSTSDSGNFDFIYPNIYFISVKPVLINSKPTSIGGSLFDSLTVNGLYTPEVPSPQDLIADSAKINEVSGQDKEVSFKLSWTWPVNRLKDYFDYTNIVPRDAANIDVSLNLYITTDSALKNQGEEYMRETFGGYSYEQRINNSIASTYTEENSHTIYFSDLNSGGVPVITNNALANLRNGSVVRVEGIKLTEEQIKSIMENGMLPLGQSLTASYTLDGLDKNKKYFAYADIVITHGPEYKAIASRMSNMSGITALVDMDVPTGSEKMPPAPVVDKENVDLSQATVIWTSNTQPTAAGETIEFEIIRVKDKQITSTLDAGSILFEAYYSKNLPTGAETAGWRTNGTGLEYYNGSAFAAADMTKFTYDNSGIPYKLTDKTLLPNQIYFYYVRTVRLVNGQRIASSWSAVSLTTTPVKSPKNLVIEQNRTDYDPKTEVVISFDAPLTSLDYLGTEYNLQYQIKMDGGNWASPVTMNAAALKASAIPSSETGYYHFIYKITGLMPSTSYSIHVRMIDVNGDGSLYTNIAPFRTDMNQEEYDLGKNTSDWLRYLREELDKLVKDPYWVSMDTTSGLEVVYRPDMFGEVLRETPDGQITLVESKASTAVYYLPAAAVISANAAGKGYKISNGDMEVIISPKAVDTSYNDALIAVAGRIKTKEITDYFIKITVCWTDYNGQVDGNAPLSRQAELSIEAVGAKQVITQWDKEVLAELSLEIVNVAESDGIAKRLKEMLSADTINEEMAMYIQNTVNTVKSGFASKVSAKLKKIINGTNALSSFDAPVIIAVKGIGEDASVSGYRYTGGVWVSMAVTGYRDGAAIYANAPGIYIFAGRSIRIAGLENAEGSGRITAIVAKYQLDDFFGRDAAFDIESNASRLAVVSSVARMAGAPKGSDASGWLKNNKNISLSSRDMYGDIQTQEAIYLVMALYESKTGTKLTTLKIRNQSLTAGITGIDDKYKTSIKAAFELELYEDQAMVPKAGIKVKDILEMLYTLDGMIGL